MHGVDVCVLVCASAGGEEQRSVVCPPRFADRISHENRDFTRLIGQQAPGICCFYLADSGIINAHYHTPVFPWMLGIELRS